MKKTNFNSRSLFALPYMIYMTIFVVVPLFMLLFFAFFGANLLRSSGDTRYGTLHAYINTEDGYADLTDQKLTVRAGENIAERTLTAEELNQALLEYFHISVEQRA